MRVPEDRDVSVELYIGGTSTAQEAAESLRGVGADYIRQRDGDPRTAPVAEFVVGGLISAGALPDLIVSMRMRHTCQQVIDATRAVMVFSENCTRRDSSILVVARRGMTVEITGIPKDADMSEIATAALNRTANEVSAAAEATGAKATVHRTLDRRREKR